MRPSNARLQIGSTNELWTDAPKRASSPLRARRHPVGGTAGACGSWRTKRLSSASSRASPTKRSGRRSKKRALRPHLLKGWVIPPKKNAAFVWRMEAVLDLYEDPYDPLVP